MGIYKPGRPEEYSAGTGGRKPPAAPGEYRIIDGERNVLYIGETVDLERRMGEHERSGKLGDNCRFAWQTADECSTSNTRREHEKQKIKQHSPALNRSRGGEGRKAEGR